MKHLIIIFLAFLWIWLPQPSADLYLLYKKSPHIDTTYKANAKEDFFAYEMYYEGKLEQKLFLFEVESAPRDTVCLSALDSLEIKDYNWLQKDFIEYYHFETDPTPRSDSDGKTRYYNLNKFYKEIFIVKIDSSKNRAILYKVHQDYLTDYEGWNIQLKDSVEK